MKKSQNSLHSNMQCLQKVYEVRMKKVLSSAVKRYLIRNFLQNAIDKVFITRKCTFRQLKISVVYFS